MQYATRSRHGIWKYRRAVPKALAIAAGRSEIIVSLRTRDDREAQLAYVKAHGEAEAYLKSLSRMAGNPKSINSDKEIWELSKAFMRQLKLHYVPLADLKAQESFDDGPSQLEQRLDLVEDLGIDINDTTSRDREIEASWKAKAILGTLKRPQFCMSDAVRVYFEQRAPELAEMSPRQERRYRFDKENVVNSLQKALGEDKPHATINRSDARTLRDYFRNKGLAISTVNKHVKTVATIWKVAAQDQELASANPFVGHTIADPVPNIEKRSTLSPEEVSALLERRSHMNPELAAILTVLAYTGARVAEITGLCSIDFARGNSTNIPHIILQPNALRGLKSHSSRRKVPLLGEALSSLAAMVHGKAQDSSQPIFERYSGDSGPTNASAALMKQLRAAGITDKKKTIHSLRHTVKQALRDVGCPKDVSDAIQGHSAGSASASYGSGYSLEVMNGWLMKAFHITRLE